MDDVSLLGLLVRLVVSLAAVLGLMALAGRGLRNRGLAGRRLGGGDAPVRVVARQSLSRGASIAVVRAGDRHLVLGVTDSSVTMLTEADADAFLRPDNQRERPPGVGPAGPSWRALLDALRERTVRRP